MTNVRQRTPDSGVDRSSKRTKLSSNGANGAAQTAAQADLTLPSADEVKRHSEDYANAVPYKYAAIGGLINDELVSIGSERQEEDGESA